MNIEFVVYDKRYLECSNEWLQDPEIKSMTMTPEFSAQTQRIWFDGLPMRTDYRIWGVACDGEPVGAVGIKHINVEKKMGEYFGYIGEKELWGKGIGRQMVGFAKEQAKKLDLHVLCLLVSPNNVRAMSLYEKSGFSIVEKISEATDGLLRYSCTI
ncbi:MAG: GNAT family N-acetyltransferase [Clostridiaceae bacterium]